MTFISTRITDMSADSTVSNSHQHLPSDSCSNVMSKAPHCLQAPIQNTVLGTRVIAALDVAGVSASTICLVHCLAMPVVIALLPAFAANLFESDWFHVTLAFTVLGFCLLAYIPGFLRHRDHRLIFLGCLGVGMVFFATFPARFLWGESAEIAIVTMGNLTLVAGHLLNRKLTEKTCCHDWLG